METDDEDAYFERCEGTNCSRVYSRVWWCKDCFRSLCDECWPSFPAHARWIKNPSGLPHEKTEYWIDKKLEDILYPRHDEQRLKELYSLDLETTWFGLVKDKNSSPSLIDHDIYSTILSHYSRSDKPRYPHIASFIGQTGAGKSTLIKMLIELRKQPVPGNHMNFLPTPIVGSSANYTKPSSADVHIYPDPDTSSTDIPVFYADCEGLDAGEVLPVSKIETMATDSLTEPPISRLVPARTRKLKWAKTPALQAREYVVSKLYPRILYTFSDVIVFVLQNPKTFQSTALRLLLEWGEASLSKSVNQPALPHLVVVLNALKLPPTPEYWDGQNAKLSLLEDCKDSLDEDDGVHFFRQLATKWRARDRQVDTIEDLILCYFSKFEVVPIPGQDRYQLISNQVMKLRGAIADSCKTSYSTKKESRMLSTSAELHVYLQSAFTHFSKTLEEPFNFVKVSLDRGPAPDDFGGHILQFAISVQSLCALKPPDLFKKLGNVVASCAILDCIRYRKRQPEEHFAKYESSFEYVLKQFCDRHIPCDFEKRKMRCVNVANAHEKGHQNAKGKVFSTGPFTSKFSTEQFCPEWRDVIEKAMNDISKDLQKRVKDGSQDESEESIFLALHKRLMQGFYHDIVLMQPDASGGLIRSHVACLSCLMQTPEHPLPCGHVICTLCIKSYGRPWRGDKNILQLDDCPLHRLSSQWHPPYVVRLKPPHAGARVLCLDGGGMRGIVEIEVLRALQGVFQDEIPLYAFFDLIVGTSTGGIVSLAFALKRWNLDDCLSTFKQLCSKAFSRRELHNVRWAKHLVFFKHASWYKTTPIRQILKESFGHDSLFGNYDRKDISNDKERRRVQKRETKEKYLHGRSAEDCLSQNYSPRVAVTATDGTGKRAMILANYNRIPGTRGIADALDYDFLRPGRPELELKVWEAAAATSAAVPFYKAFVHEATEKTYLDGAFYHNNPVKVAEWERKLIWPDVAERHPDILLSIGTSQNGQKIGKDLKTKLPTPRGTSSENLDEHIPKLDTTRGKKSFAEIRQSTTAMKNRIDSVLNAEQIWQDFRTGLRNERFDEMDSYRYVRINPDIGYDPPGFDQVSQLNDLQSNARKILMTPDSKAQIEKTAQILVASCFYYEKEPYPKDELFGPELCHGRLRCKFEDGSAHLQALGRYMERQQTSGFQPFFEIKSEEDPSDTRKLEISPDVIASMKDRATFRIKVPGLRVKERTSEFNISLALDGKLAGRHKVPVSGFPRAIMAE